MQPAAAVSVENTHTRDVITSTGERERERERERELVQQQLGEKLLHLSGRLDGRRLL